MTRQDKIGLNNLPFIRINYQLFIYLIKLIAHKHHVDFVRLRIYSRTTQKQPPVGY